VIMIDTTPDFRYCCCRNRLGYRTSTISIILIMYYIFSYTVT